MPRGQVFLLGGRQLVDPRAGRGQGQPGDLGVDGRGHRMDSGGQPGPPADQPHQRERLGRDDLVHGTFGENLTVEELPETLVAIGDEFEIGTARFQVTQPRLPCFKLGIVMGDQGFIRTFQKSGRTGFYLRVLREGTMEAGDEIRRFPTPDAQPVTVAEMVRIISARHPKPDDARRALKLGALSEGWKRQIEGKLGR